MKKHWERDEVSVLEGGGEDTESSVLCRHVAFDLPSRHLSEMPGLATRFMRKEHERD